MLTKKKKGRKTMKKLPLLLICATLAVPTAAQASSINARSLFNIFNRARNTQTTKTDRQTVTKNILKALGIDIDKFNIPSATAKPTAAPTVKPTAAPVVKPTAAPTAKPTVAPTSKPTTAPTAKPTAAPTVKPTAKPTTAPVSNSMTAMEDEVLRLTNEERAKVGAPPLKRASDLDALARAHSQDMISRHFFDHNNPDGKSPFDRMRAAGITYRAAAENIAYGQSSAASVMNAWMNSSGHRKNILNATYTEIGIGAIKNSGGTIYWTQEFVKR